MGKVKQAIQEVQQEVMEIVMSRTSLERGHETITLPEVQTILFKKYWHKDNNGYFLKSGLKMSGSNLAEYVRLYKLI